jgi:riboflavin kinase/FMN adenylyltransferase
MQILQVFSSTNQLLVPTRIALGNFDGVHLGHQKILSTLTEEVQEKGGYSTVVSFYPHPRSFFSGQFQPLLTPQPEKVALLGNLGLDQLVLLSFDHRLAHLSPQQFVREILLEKLQACSVMVGEDFRFGHQRRGTIHDLQDLGAQAGLEVIILALKMDGAGRISSSRIRSALAQGHIDLVNQLLGRPYVLLGTVVKGQQLGHQLGFPTANLHIPPDKQLPRLGVYAVRVFIANGQSPLAGVMNVGDRPTLNQSQQTTAEIHLLDWQGNLYGQILKVELLHFLRPEQKFLSIGDLTRQIKRDCQGARKILAPLWRSKTG